PEADKGKDRGQEREFKYTDLPKGGGKDGSSKLKPNQEARASNARGKASPQEWAKRYDQVRLNQTRRTGRGSRDPQPPPPGHKDVRPANDKGKKNKDPKKSSDSRGADKNDKDNSGTIPVEYAYVHPGKAIGGALDLQDTVLWWP